MYALPRFHFLPLGRGYQFRQALYVCTQVRGGTTLPPNVWLRPPPLSFTYQLYLSMLMTRRIHMSSALVLAVLLTMTMVACDSSGDAAEDPQFLNEFSFSISEVGSSSSTTSNTRGIVNRQSSPIQELDGFSFFFAGTVPETGEEAFALYFSSGDELTSESANEGLFGFAFRESPRPSAGTYDFGALDGENGPPAAEFGMIVFENIGDFGDSETGFTWYFVDGGTIDLTSSGSGRVDGEIRAEAMRHSFDGMTTDSTRVLIEGTFASDDVETLVNFETLTP